MSLRSSADQHVVENTIKSQLMRMIMQELLTAITYPIVWIICAYLLKIESGLAKLLISLTAAILVYVLLGIMHANKEKNKENED